MPPGDRSPTPDRPSWLAGFALRRSLCGLVVAAAAFAASTGPSLVPRGWIFQGIISAFSLVFGYGVGVGARWLAGRIGLRPLPEARRRRLALATWVSFAVVLLVTVLTGAATQRRLAALWGQEPTASAHAVSTLTLALALCWLLILAGRGLRALVRFLGRALGRWLPAVAARWASVGIALALAAGTVVVLVNQVVLGTMTDAYLERDATTRSGTTQPTRATRSGSPESTQAWDTLGYEGRNFVASGPNAANIADVTGAEAMEPIRVYAGLASQPGEELDADLEQVAQSVVAELDRTDAWDREVLVVATTTGTGWVDPATAVALEYVTAGNSAIAAMQYSVNPSWVTLLLDRDRPTEAGKALFDAVYEAWLTHPEGERPLLATFGVSLGSYGSQAAFDSLADLTDRADGALWTGTPRFTGLWQQITSARDAGTGEIHPVLDGGATVRWGTENGGDQNFADLGPASGPRVAYLQHPSDGVVWWWLPTFWHRDEWFSEPPGQDVLPGVRWWPIITGLQLTGDMFVAGAPTVPLGYGHNYAEEYVDGWTWVTGARWDEARMDAMRHAATQVRR